MLPRRLRCFTAARALVSGKRGLEIGGPSDVFARNGRFPVYALAASLDNCNFSAQTVWAGAAPEGRTFVYDARRAPGHQYILEATALTRVADGAYDFVLASHVIEHVANPLRALGEWIRAVRTGGAIVLVVPHRDGAFDHRRPVSSLQHLIADERNGTTEDDLTHLPEILALHDLDRDPAAGDLAAFKARSDRNRENRCLHHHVFDTNLAIEVANHAGLQIVAAEAVRPYHIFLVCRKLPARERPDNRPFLGPGAAYRRQSPFRTDRVPRA